MSAAMVAVKQEEDQQSQPAAAHSSFTPPPKLTPSNGIGQWDIWKRNFENPLNALLDLMDNSFDAATGSVAHRGRIHVSPDVDDFNESTTGMYIINNSTKHIKPMAQVLEVYRSSKGGASETIGENGVGIKQACAMLSDLSFCLSKNHDSFSLGVIAAKLQRSDGICLPSFCYLELPEADELYTFFSQTNTHVGECIREYGNDSLERGIERLLLHMQEMAHVWQDDPHVFCVVLHHLRHGQETHEYQQGAISLMNKLKDALPRRYIHVPSTLDVRVDNKPIAFSYWQRRLVELTSFQVKIDPHHPFTTAQDWRDPAEGYTLRIYAGFDPIRQEETSACASLLVYSRQSGRLITESEDARGVLGLSNGGTDFAQGLTILVDDFHGKLPLNPTKQNIAFGENTQGETHRCNLYAWLAAVTQMYYKMHLKKFPGKRKGLLTEEVKRHLPQIKQFHRPNFQSKPLPECQLTTYQNIMWYISKNRIRMHSTSRCEEVVGPDTRVKITAPAVLPAAAPAKKARNKKSTAAASAEAPNGIQHDLMCQLQSLEYRIPRKRKASSSDEEQCAQRKCSSEDEADLEQSNAMLEQKNSAQQKLEEQLEEKTRECSELKRKEKNLETENSSLKRGLAQLARRVKELEAAQLARKVKELEAALARSEEEKTAYASKLAQLKDTISGMIGEV